MFTKLARGAALAAALSLTAGAAAQAAAGTAYQISSPVYWSSNGDHADLVLHYDPRATATLTISQFYVLDAFGANVSQILNTCGTPVKTGDSVTAHQLSPGQICFLRAYRTGDAIVARAVLSDGSGTTTGIAQFARTSVEIRDVNDSVITHVEVR